MNKDSKDGEKPLPAGWLLCQSKNSGRTYYFNRKTGKSLWTQPQAEDKSRSPVQNKLEKPRNEEPEKKNLKRKSDSRHEDTSPKKKPGRETPTSTPEKPKESTPASVKNSASKRLQQLRKQLTQDIHRDERTTDKNQTKSLVKYKPDERRQSPKVNHPDTPTKSKPIDLKSPAQSSLTDSRSSTNTQSPSSDSLQSIPSPSQFFAANKILSSMKAQLPDEYCITTKSKDTFADIDQAICSQILEYPSTKHPSTPPQFSEASKIVSAIKSKLEYKSLADNLNSTEVKVYSTANDRMKALRTSLSKEASGEMSELNSSFVNNECKTALKPDEAMEIEVFREKVSRVNPPCTSSTTNNTENTKENLVIVIDTNIFIHELDVIKNVVNSHIKGYAQHPTLLVPWRVINELDRLKDNNNGNGAICKRARSAMDYLYQSLPENKRIKGQSLRDANSHIYPCEIPDDEILNCCLQQAERGNSVILITNDKNLCSKAIINAVKSITLGELKTMMVNKPQEGADPDLQATMKRYENSIYQLLANILENEMRAKYNTLWQHVLFKAPPWSLRDVLQCLLKHWIAVFSEVFPRIEHLITELKNALITAQDRGDSLTQSQVNNFKDLSLEVARKCQIIPEYLELAKLTVERISRREPPEARSEEMPVIEAFEAVWTVLSSYCAKLSSGLGITHSIEDKLIGDEPLTALTGKFRVFSDQIHSFTNTIKGVLNVSSDTDPALNSLTRCLESVFKDCLHLISADTSAVSRESLKLFCTKCRNMLQEAYTKFAHLTELLEMCQNVMND